MKLTRKHINKGFTLVELLVVIAIIAALAAMATPVIMKQKKKGDMMTAVSNAKQVFLLMVEFDQDFAGFPSDKTAAQDADITTYTGPNSNDYLGQFLAASYVQSEEIFFAKGGSPSGDLKPDNVYDTKANTLKAGECGFAYVVNLSGSSNAGLPLLMAPMTSVTEFDPDPYGGKGVVLRVDGSVTGLRLTKDTNLAKTGGSTLFEAEVWTDAVSGGGTDVPTVLIAK